jgi:hypothetical protein
MTNYMRTIGTICIVVCTLCVVWGMIGMAYTVPSETQQYRFDGVYAAEGTVFTVKDGQLVLIGGSNFSVAQPLRRIVNLSLWGLCFLMTLLCGIILLRFTKKRGTDGQEIRVE